MPERTPTAASIRRWLVIVSLPLAIVLLALWKPDYQPPIFDAQVHYNQNAWKRVRVEAIGLTKLTSAPQPSALAAL